MPRPNSGDDDADGDAEDESPRPAAARDSQSSGRANMPDPLEPALPAPAYPAADYAFTGERPLSLPSMPSDRLAAPAALEQPPPAAAADVEPPAKRRRGRPRSVVFNYFVREQEPGGGLVNRCIFCNFKSRDKSQNPTYLARHCITACRAPPEVVDLLQQSRASSSHSARQASGPAAYDDAGASPAPSAPPTVAVEQPTGASYSPNYRPDARLVGPSPGAADFQAGRRMAPASASSPPAMPRRRDHWLGNQNQLLPVPAPSVLLTPPSALMSPVEPALHDAGVSPLFPRRLGAASPHEPLERPGQRSTLSAVSLPQRPYSSEMFQSQPQQHQPPPPPPQEHVRQQQPAPQQQGQPQTQQLQQVRPLSEPHELRRQPQHGTTGGTPLPQQPLAFQPVGVPYYEEPPSQRGPRSQARNEEGLSQLQQPRLGPPHAGRHGKLPALPSFSHVQLDRSRRQADASPAPGYTSGLRPDLIASTLPAYPSLDDERRRLTDRCTAAVHSMLTDAVTSTLICLGAAQSRNLRTVGQEVDPLEGATGSESGPAGALPVQTLRAGAYDGVCSAMAIDTHGTLVYLGAEDCMLPSQLTSFVSSCTGKHLEEGSFCAILFACDPWDPAVAAFADVQSRCQNLFLVLDVARAADEICGRIVRASASAAKCADQTLCIARFLATNDVMPVSDELDAIQNLPNATRFSAVAPAMLQLAANRQKVADALSAFQPDAGPASRHSGGGGGGASRFASYGVELLSSDSFVQALFNTAKFLELVALYDDGLRTPSRGFHMVSRDCEDAAQALDLLPPPEYQVTSHSSIARMASSCLVGQRKSTVGAGVIAGNAALLASYLDPFHAPPPQGTMSTWREQRLYHAVHVACSSGGVEKVDAVWNQLLRFMYHKETTFSSEALSSAASMAATPALWWARFGRAAVPDLCHLAIKVLSIPASCGPVARHVASVTAADTRLRGAAMRREPAKRDHIFCAWNAQLSKMRDEELMAVASPLDFSLADVSELLSR